MFSAFTETKEWIHLFHLPDTLITALPPGNYFCPDCGQPVFLKRGSIKTPHFAHITSCTASSESPAESSVHLKGKYTLYEIAQSHFSDSEIEYYFKAFQQRTDVYIPVRHFVLEYQCSKISHHDIALRQQNYASFGLKCLWIVHTKHMPVCESGYRLIKLSHFLQACIQHHSNGGKTLMFWDAQKDECILFILHDTFAHNEYLVEVMEWEKMKAWMWFVSPKESTVPETITIDLLYQNQLKQIRQLFEFENRETFLYHGLARKWKIRTHSFPLYIGLTMSCNHTLGREVKWQFKVVNFIKTRTDLHGKSPDDITEAFLYSLPHTKWDTGDNRKAIELYIHFLLMHGLPQKSLRRRVSDMEYLKEWYRFQTLAKPSKD